MRSIPVDEHLITNESVPDSFVGVIELGTSSYDRSKNSGVHLHGLYWTVQLRQ